MCNDLKGTAHSAQDKFWGFTFFKAYISFWYRKKTHAQCMKWEVVGEVEVLTFWSKLIFWSKHHFFVQIDDFIKKSWSFDQIYVFLNLIISSMIVDIIPFREMESCITGKVNFYRKSISQCTTITKSRRHGEDSLPGSERRASEHYLASRFWKK